MPGLRRRPEHGDGELQALTRHLIHCLGLVRRVHPEPGVEEEWSAEREAGDRLLICFDPPALSASDSRVVQLVLNAPGPVDDAGRTLHDDLQACLSEALLAPLVGYSLVYEADLAPGVDAGSVARALLPAARPLFTERGRPPAMRPPRSCVEGGFLWLVRVPSDE